jgi:hypothetical protein
MYVRVVATNKNIHVQKFDPINLTLFGAKTHIYVPKIMKNKLKDMFMIKSWQSCLWELMKTWKLYSTSYLPSRMDSHNLNQIKR